MEKQWIDNLRKRFADRKAPVPDGLWDSIESAMAGMDMPEKSAVKKKRARVVPVWTRWTAAAVACAAVALCVMKYNGSEPSAVSVERRIAQNVVNAYPDDREDANVYPDEHEYAEKADVESTPAAWNGVKSKVAGVVSEVRERATAIIENEKTGGAAAIADNAIGDSLDDKKLQQKKNVAIVNSVSGSHRNDKYSSTKNDNILASVSEKSKDLNVSVGLYGANFMAVGASGGNRGSMIMTANTYGDPIFNKDFTMLAIVDPYLNRAGSEENEVKVKHRQPVRVGMSVRLRLTDRLGVETGMNYSYLSSDIGSGDDEGGFRTEQKLHYVGVPLGFNYGIWNTDFLEVYASAGAMAEFCVAGHSATEYVSDKTVVRRTETDVKDSRPQWSVNAAAGVQYNFNDVIGIYVEPGVSYYFNNGSSVTTIYKDKPFNFNLNLGLRFTVR